MGKKRAYSASPSITSGDRCRASLPGLDLLLGMGACGGSWGPQATGLMPAALGRKPHKPSGQIPCQQIIPSLKFSRNVYCKLYPLPLVYSSLAIQNTQMLDVGRGLCMPAGNGRYRPRTVYSLSPVPPGCPTARLTSLVASDFLLYRFSPRR